MAKASLTPEIFTRVMLLQGTVFLNNISKLMLLGASAEQKAVVLLVSLALYRNLD